MVCNQHLLHWINTGYCLHLILFNFTSVVAILDLIGIPLCVHILQIEPSKPEVFTEPTFFLMDMTHDLGWETITHDTIHSMMPR